MAQLIDSYINCKGEYGGKWFVAKPMPDTRLKLRIKDTLGVLIGKYTAIYFKADLKQRNT